MQATMIAMIVVLAVVALLLVWPRLKALWDV